VGGQRRAGVVQLVEQARALGVCEEREARDGEAGVGGGGFEQAEEVPGHAPDGRLVEEVCVVFERGGEAAGQLRDRERQIKLRHALAQPVGFEEEAADLHPRARLAERERSQPLLVRRLRLVQPEHRLKERRARGVALGL
jgi:hypothetical protein